jgi:hypothetical protein
MLGNQGELSFSQEVLELLEVRDENLDLVSFVSVCEVEVDMAHVGWGEVEIDEGFPVNGLKAGVMGQDFEV